VAGVDVSRLTLPRRWNSIAAWSWLGCRSASAAAPRFLHQFQEIGLDPAAADVPAHQTGRGGDLVDLVEVDDAVLGDGGVAVGAVDEFTDEILDVAADVAGLAELGGVGLDERHADEIGDGFDQVGLADAGRAEQDDVLFDVIAEVVAPGAGFDVVVVVANGNREGFLGVVLLDDEPVEVGFDVLGFAVEREVGASGLASWPGGTVSTVSDCGVANTTRSPNSFFMNSDSFRWISSGRATAGRCCAGDWSSA